MWFPLITLLAVAPMAPPDTVVARPQLKATRLVEPVTIDGRLDEAIWSGPAPITSLTQSSPTEGAPATEAAARPQPGFGDGVAPPA